MLMNLSGKSELANGRRRLKIQRCEVHAFLLARSDHLNDARECLTFGEIARPRLVHISAKCVVQLERIDTQVDMRRAKSGRFDKPRQRRNRPSSFAELRSRP